MTLCEISTAVNHAVPLECAPFIFDTQPGEDNDKRALRRDSQGICVEWVDLFLF